MGDGAAKGDARGLVRPSQARDAFGLDRFAPPPPLDRHVDRFWRTEWHLSAPFVQSIVTFPVVNLVVQSDGSAVVSGVQRHNDERRLEGDGWALGAMFRPAGFRPFAAAAMSTYVDARLPASEVLGTGFDEIVERVVAAEGAPAAVAAMADFLLARAPSEPAVGEELSTLIETAVAEDPPVTRVDELARRFGVSVRSLQRLFAEHVGVSPKVVLHRYRVQAAGEAARDPARSWTDEAQRLGYADQAHLTVDVSRHFGAPPATYARGESAAENDD
ncbi:MAG: helix-turn-helix transcriptional regulator [Actinomycetota bacterium]